MHARKTGRKGGWTMIRYGIRRRNKVCCLVKRKGSFCCKGELARIDSCYVFLRCASDYMMAGSVFWLELGLIKG
jgi:hypothetical protein